MTLEAQLESKNPEGYDNSSTQVDLPLQGQVAGWAARHLADDVIDTEKGDGIERQPHVTVLYGLTDPDVSEVERIARAHGGPISLEIRGLGHFDAPDYDVLFAKVVSDDLNRLHRQLRRLPNVFRFPTYSPHMTIAYLKKGVAKSFDSETSDFDGEYSLPGFWLNLAKNRGNIFMPTVLGTFNRSPFNEDLEAALDDLGESIGRRRPSRQMRLLYLRRKPQGVPPPETAVEALIDDLIWDVHQAFDWSTVYSGDRRQARIAARDLYNDLMKLAAVVIDAESKKSEGLIFTLADVQNRWRTLINLARKSSEAAHATLRRQVRV